MTVTQFIKQTEAKVGTVVSGNLSYFSVKAFLNCMTQNKINSSSLKLRGLVR